MIRVKEGIGLHQVYLEPARYDSAYVLNLYNTVGSLKIGPANTAYCHFDTDRGQFWFSKPIHVNGGLHFYQTPNANTRLYGQSTGDLDLYTTARSRFKFGTEGLIHWYKGSTASWYVVAGQSWGD